jgi:hypothetical protein
MAKQTVSARPGSSRPSSKFRAWVRPALPDPAPDEPKGDADALWARGAEAESAYEFETARLSYLASLRAAPAHKSAEFTHKYAEFLVERFGQFDEVAAWLDDPGFDAGEDASGLALLRLLARAAREAHHPREVTLDEALAARGDAQGLQKTAQRLMDAGQGREARQLLERHAADLEPLGPADKLLTRLRNEELQRCVEALAPLEQALHSHDLGPVRADIETLRSTWGHAAPFLSLEARLRAAEVLAQASRLREAIDVALDAGDLDQAHEAARALAALDGATEADRNYLVFIGRRQREVQLRALLDEVAAAADEVDALRFLARMADRFGVEEPHGEVGHDIRVDRHAEPWSVVREAAGLQAPPLAEQLSALQQLLALRTALDMDDAEAADLRLRALPATWQKGPTALKAKALVQARAQARDRQAEATLVQALQTLLDAERWDDAATALHGWMRGHPVLSPELKGLRSDLQVGRQNQDKRIRLLTEFHDRLDRDAFFAARTTLAELAHLLPEADRKDLQHSLDDRAAPALRAKGMPPGVQKLKADQPIATGIAHGRLLLVQEHVWLAVNLETGGLQPFALPEAWPVHAQAWTRIAAVGDRIRLVGLSGQRLVVIEQVPGQPPAVVSGADLRTLLRGDDLLIGAALQPDAKTWRLLARSSRRDNASTWLRIDPTTLEVLDYRKTSPMLESMTGIDGAADQGLAITAPRQRQAFALAQTDDHGQEVHAFAEDEVGEPLATLRQAFAWPAQDRVYASFTTRDPFGLDANLRGEPSLLVLRGGRISFLSSELRKRFVPMERMTIDHPWTLDAAQGRLWFAALPYEGEGKEALLLGVDARTLRPDKAVVLEGVERVLALLPTADGVIALGRLQGGGFALTRGRMDPVGLTLTTTRLPL